MWWHTVTNRGGWGLERGKLANAVCSQYPSHYFRTRCTQHYYRWCAHLGCQQSTELTPTGRFKWTGRFRHKDQLWFLHVCHHISTGLYCSIYTAICVCPAFVFTGCWFLLYGYISMHGQQNIKNGYNQFDIVFCLHLQYLTLFTHWYTVITAAVFRWL